MFKEFAWNRIRFQAPSYWNIAGISSTYLLLEDKAGPVMEIKWAPIKGKFSAKNQMRRLLSLNNKQLLEPVRECPMPPDWKNRLKDFKSTCFSWKGNKTGAKGLVLFCSSCKKVTLLQFYNRSSDKNKTIYPTILKSYSDHSSDEQIPWSIFDIRFKLAKKFQIMSHRFEPGEFELYFAARGQKLRLFRWGPASIILNNISLLDFAKKKFRSSAIITAPQESEQEEMVQWEHAYSKNPYLNCLRSLMGLYVISRYCLWHIPDKNRILGIVMDSRKIDINKDFKKILSKYECS